MPATKQLTFPLQLKSTSNLGEFEGMLAVYNNVDLGNDCILPGAIKEIVTTPDGSLRILDSHDARSPVGKAKFTDTPGGLKIAGKLDLAVARARELLSLMKSGIINGLSIGYDVIGADGSEIRQDGVRLLKRLKLWEGSLVVFPMNGSALISSVKGIDQCKSIGDWEATLRALSVSKRKARAMAIANWKIYQGPEPEIDPAELTEQFNLIAKE
jgi:HK97 family phage prohead protease